MPPDGTLKDQQPGIFYKNAFYTISLRMMKAIYRHVRLHKGFVNVENVNGIAKQRIPELLLREKIRTQSRFDVSTCGVFLIIHIFNISSNEFSFLILKIGYATFVMCFHRWKEIKSIIKRLSFAFCLNASETCVFDKYFFKGTGNGTVATKMRLFIEKGLLSLSHVIL